MFVFPSDFLKLNSLSLNMQMETYQCLQDNPIFATIEVLFPKFFFYTIQCYLRFHTVMIPLYFIANLITFVIKDIYCQGYEKFYV